MDCIQFYVFTYCTTFLKMHKTFPLNKVLFSSQFYVSVEGSGTSKK